MKLTLIAQHPESDDVTSFKFRSDAPLRWQAGQFLQYTLPHQDVDDRGASRYFTIASAPFETDVMLTTRFASERSSSFKRALGQLRVGATIEASDPDGDFVVDDPSREHVLIAGGIGITPFRAMLLDLDHQNLPINATLVYASRSPAFVYRAELDGLAVRHPHLVIRYLVSPARVTETSIRDVAADLAKPTFHVSGPEPFVEALGTMLAGLGVPDAHVKRDYFPGYDWANVEQQEDRA
jgi:ferredoxin-NADP reductase